MRPGKAGSNGVFIVELGYATREGRVGNGVFIVGLEYATREGRVGFA